MSADHARDAHDPFDELAVGWALHALEPDDEAVFVAHLPGCERCATTVAETSEAMAAMATDLPQAEPSAALRDRHPRGCRADGAAARSGSRARHFRFRPTAAPVPAPSGGRPRAAVEWAIRPRDGGGRCPSAWSRPPSRPSSAWASGTSSSIATGSSCRRRSPSRARS